MVISAANDRCQRSIPGALTGVQLYFAQRGGRTGAAGINHRGTQITRRAVETGTCLTIREKYITGKNSGAVRECTETNTGRVGRHK